MATKRKMQRSKKVASLFPNGYHGMGDILKRLEKELNRTVKTVRKQSVKQGESVMKSFDEIIDSIGASEITSKAFEKTDEWKKEVRKEVRKIVKNFKNLDLNMMDHPVVENIKDNVNAAFNRVHDMEVMEFAKGKVHDTKNQVFTLLNIPSQVEVDNLTRKLVALEKKIKTISKHKTRTRR